MTHADYRYHLVVSERELELVLTALGMTAEASAAENHIKDADEMNALLSRLDNDATKQWDEHNEERENR